MRARTFRRMLNVWPPLVGAGIKVMEFSDDYMHVRVRLRMNRLNRNAVGSHFGGSIYAMTDPFFMLMLLHHLGEDHVVWDKAAEIEFVKPGRGDIVADFRITPETIAELRAEAAGGDRVLRWFTEEVVDAGGEVVAIVRKQLYVRRKREKPAS